MKVMMRMSLLLIPLALLACQGPGVPAKEPPAMHEADQSFAAGRYEAALQHYEAALRQPLDERSHARALFRAVECEQLLYRHEAALDRLRAAKLPHEEGLKALFLLGRLELLRSVADWYGFGQEAEAGAQGSAKLSRAQAKGEEEAAAQALWQQRAELARLPLERFSEVIVQKDIDTARYPSLWDFVALRLDHWLKGMPGHAPPEPFAAEEFSGKFESGQPSVVRRGALFEASAALDGGAVERGVAKERWRIARVMLGAAASTIPQAKEGWREAAIHRLEGWTRTLHTPLGRGAAAWQAGLLLSDLDRKAEALRLVEAALPHTPESDVAVGLRQLRHDILLPALSVMAQATRDGRGAIALTSRNLTTVWLRLYRLDPLHLDKEAFWSNLLRRPGHRLVEALLAQGEPIAAWTAATGDKGDHREAKRSIDLPQTDLGLYLVVAANEPAFAPSHSLITATFANITDLAIARTEEADGMRLYAFDVGSGGVAKSVQFHLQRSDDWRTKSSALVKADAQGLGLWRWPTASQTQIDALAMRDHAVAWFGNELFHARPSPEPPLVLYLTTDRPIYRPGQKLQVRVTSVARLREGGYKVDSKRKLVVELQDPNGKTVGKQTVTTDGMGAAATEFVLPAGGLLGSFQLVATAPGLSDVHGELSLRIEEYKRPEFEVTLEAPKGAARFGETAQLAGQVRYYFGGAAPQVPVRFKVSRRRWLPFWAWRRGESPKVEIARGETKTDAEGHFTVRFVAAADPTREEGTDPNLPQMSDFIVEVEAHDAGGRTIAAERSLRVGARAVLLSAASEEGFYRSSESPVLEVHATNLEEQPQAARLAWELERLGAPEPTSLPPGGQPLQSLLAAYPVAQANVAHGTVTIDHQTPGKLTLPALPAGGYRVTLRQEDGDGRGTFAFLVVDAQTGTLPLSLPAIALLRRAPLQPGDQAELLIGASAASGTYHIERWRGDHLLSHELARGAPVRVVTLPVTARGAGGFTLRWIGVAGMTALAEEVAVPVPHQNKALTVSLVDKPESLEPGQKSRFTVQIKDQKGRPVAGEALVRIYDRSLEPYAKDEGDWAGELWAPPPSPPSPDTGEVDGGRLQLSQDEEGLARAQRQIEGHYRPHELPRFVWQGTGGFRNRRYMTLAASGAPMPSAPHAKRVANDSAKEVVDKDTGTPAEAAPLRTNMAETAAFVPDLRLDRQGRGSFAFTAPERLTSWRVQIYALGRAVEAGVGQDTFATKKALMVRVEIPRFFREGDRSTVMAVVHNETDQPLTATVTLDITDEATGKSALEHLGLTEPQRRVEVAAHGLAQAAFPVTLPEGLASYQVRAQASAGSLADAEARSLPVLPSRQRLVQSRLVALRGDEQKTLTFDELAHTTDPSLRSDSLTVTIDPTLALSVLRSIPSLVESPYDCVEQVVNRYVPLAIVDAIYAKHPELARIIATAPHRESQVEPWIKEDPRRQLALQETPWLVQSEGGRRDERLRDLLNPQLVASLRTTTLAKLKAAQLGSGAFPWFPGGRDDFYMTLYTLEQLAMLQEFGIAPPEEVVRRALDYVSGKMEAHLGHDVSDVSFLAYGSYVVTSFDPRSYPAAAKLRQAVERWMKYVLDNQQILTPLGRAFCARVEARLGDQKTAMMLLESALDGAKSDPLVGIYWTPERYSWLWYSDTIGKHAFFLRTLAELKPEDERIPGLLQWLLFNRKGNQWSSTKASAAAVYSILELMEKQGALQKPERFRVAWDKEEQLVTVKPNEDRREPLSWTVRGEEVTPARARIEVGKKGPGVAFASATWVFSSTQKQAAHASDVVSLERKYFRRVHQADGDHLLPLGDGDKVHVGEPIEVKLVIKSKSQLEYVHLKDPRGAGFEETTLTSGWRWQKVSAYLEPRDSLFNFFIDWLPHGELELQHSLRPTTPGRYRIGSAVLQSMYAPDMTAYSGGIDLEVVP